MRNLKKLLAVIMTVALIASMMVPALAAGTYESEAAKLKEIGLFVGTTKTDGSTDFLLGSELYRDQAMILIIRALGEEKAALALTDAEVAETLANVVDADKIASWAKKYAAYALKEKLTYGVGGVEAGKIKFGPDATIDGTDFTILLLRALGYSTVSKTTVLDVVVEAGVLSQIDAIAALSAKPYYRDFAAHTIFGAVKNGETADGESFIETLIAAGAVDAAKAASAGFIAPAPTTLEVVGVSATNLKEIVVTFNTALDKDSAEKAANYSVDGKTVASVKLNSDGKSVTILLSDKLGNQSEFKVTVTPAVKSAAGIALADDVTKSGYVFDNVIPTPLSAVQAGPDSFKVTFSEPVQLPATGSFKVDGGTYFVAEVTTSDNFYTAIVTLYSTLPTGVHKVEVSNVLDFAGYNNVVTTLEFSAEKDEVPPAVVSVEKASPLEVVLVFNEDIKLNVTLADIISNTKIWHTNSSNVPSNVEVDGNKLTITFADSKKLPNGTAYLYIAKEVVKDLWSNKNVEVKDLALSVVVDVTKPTVAKAESPKDDQIVITYSEKVDTSTGKFTVLDNTGKEISSSKYNVAKVTTSTSINFNESLSGSTYSVVVEGVKDLAGNEIDKVQVPVAVVDTTAPVITTKAALYADKNIVKISFNEVMNSDDLLNLGNYWWSTTGKYLNDKDSKVTVSVTDGGKAVLLDFTKVSGGFTGGYFNVGKVRDLAGNATSDFVTTVTVADAALIGIKSVEATSKSTIVVTLTDSLSKFVASDFVISTDSGNQITPASVTFNNVDGEGVITYTLRDADKLLTTGLTTPDSAHIVISTIASQGAITSANNLGAKVGVTTTTPAISDFDNIAPEFDAAFTADKEITVTFTESVKLDTVSRTSFTVSGNTVNSITYVYAGGSTTLLSGVVLNLKEEVKTTGTEVKVTQGSDKIEDQYGNGATGLEKTIKR